MESPPETSEDTPLPPVTASVTVAAIPARALLLEASAWCPPITCPISCPITNAIPASVFKTGNIPV